MGFHAKSNLARSTALTHLCKSNLGIKTSSKHNARCIAAILKAHACRRVVIAPGSRNAPLILAFSADSHFKCYSVPDERSAAFTAMGMTLEGKEPVAVVCTSGSAAMNFYPAVAEAYYQKLPLIIITADRPLELIDQGVGQTVRQQGVFGEHIVAEANLLREPGDDLTRSYNQRVINEVMLASKTGPVHINVPFDEPLYDTQEIKEEDIKIIRKLPVKTSLPDLKSFSRVWNESSKILVLAGHMPSNSKLQALMVQLNQKSPYLVLSESVTNLHLPNGISTIDRLVNTIDEEEKNALQADLVITMGGEIVSKMIKQYLQQYPAQHHWHLSETGEVRDTFQQLTGVLNADPSSFFEALLSEVTDGDPTYRDHWLSVAEQKQQAHTQYLKQVEFSDFAVFDAILKNIPANSILHSANSASIRYAQLFEHQPDLEHHTNRGTSGIDGCTSTAIGHAQTSDKAVILVTGDVAFLYDSNAFWNNQLPPNLRVIVINNGGGNIFRIIKGPDGQEEFERFQETTHNLNLAAIGQLYGIEHELVEDIDALNAILAGFLDIKGSEAPAILEVKTPRLRNPEVLLQYFNHISKHSH